MNTQKLVQKPLLIFIVFVFAIMFFAPHIKADSEEDPACTQAVLVWEKAATACLRAIKSDLKTGLDTMEAPCGDSLKNKESKMYEVCGIAYQTRL